jgi:cell division inhibitor SepF
MSALRRLKAYFGMVPAEEFDAAGFDHYHAAGFDSYHDSYHDYHHSDYGSGYPEPAHSTPREREHVAERAGTGRPHRPAFDGYDDSVVTAESGVQDGYPATPRVHPSRLPSRGTESRVMEPRARESWVTQAPVRGSLAMETAAPDVRPPVHQPAAPHRAPQRIAPVPRTDPLAGDLLGDDGVHPLARIVTLHPHNYNEARPIGERYREGNPVIMNLTEMEDRDAKRLVDFAAGLAFALRGSIDKVTNKVFLLSPPNVDVSAEDRRRIAEGHFVN